MVELRFFFFTSPPPPRLPRDGNEELVKEIRILVRSTSSECVKIKTRSAIFSSWCPNSLNSWPLRQSNSFSMVRKVSLSSRISTEEGFQLSAESKVGRESGARWQYALTARHDYSAHTALKAARALQAPPLRRCVGIHLPCGNVSLHASGICTNSVTAIGSDAIVAHRIRDLVGSNGDSKSGDCEIVSVLHIRQCCSNFSDVLLNTNWLVRVTASAAQ